MKKLMLTLGLAAPLFIAACGEREEAPPQTPPESSVTQPTSPSGTVTTTPTEPTQPAEPAEQTPAEQPAPQQ